eukprot:3424278-Lingulodinium_polyedra.AAC.1
MPFVSSSASLSRSALRPSGPRSGTPGRAGRPGWSWPTPRAPGLRTATPRSSSVGGLRWWCARATQSPLHGRWGTSTSRRRSMRACGR